MGEHFRFQCVNCDYGVEVSGELDVGLRCATFTILCEDCKEVMDVIVSEDMNDLVLAIEGKFKVTEFFCEKSKDHKVVEWNDTFPCPKCNDNMTRGELTVLWD